MVVRGYKAFHNDMTNQVGMQFEENKTYIAPLPIMENYKGNGYHFAKNLEDTLCFVKNEDVEIKVAEVTGYGVVREYEYDYYGYYDLYCAEKLKVERILTREEVLQLIMKKHELAVERFVSYYILTPSEIEFFKKRYASMIKILRAIAYYREGDKQVYERQYIKRQFPVNTNNGD